MPVESAEKGYVSTQTPGSVEEKALNPDTFPVEAFESTGPSVATPILTLKDEWDFNVGKNLTVVGTCNLAPVGSIVMYGGATAPSSWLLCNGAAVSRTTYAALFVVVGTTFGVGNGTTTFNVPDFAGIFPRGAGTSTKLTNANASAFAGTLGTYQNDKMQGHMLRLEDSLGATNGADLGSGQTVARRLTSNAGGVNCTLLYGKTFITDGINGAPRAGDETNPANLTVTFIIKY